MKDLDDEALDTPTGYDFAGYGKHGTRERKQAVRFINQAVSELGGDNKAAVIARAQELAGEALGKATGKKADLYRESITVLQKSAERVRSDGAKETKGSGGKKYLDDLDSETAIFPFRLTMRNADAVDPRVQKLVARIYRDILANAGPMPDPSTDPEGNKKWVKTVFRRAQRAAHPDLNGDLTDDQKVLFDGAQKVFGEVKERYI
jgi:hypothetical protein